MLIKVPWVFNLFLEDFLNHFQVLERKFFWSNFSFKLINILINILKLDKVVYRIATGQAENFFLKYLDFLL